MQNKKKLNKELLEALEAIKETMRKITIAETNFATPKQSRTLHKAKDTLAGVYQTVNAHIE